MCVHFYNLMLSSSYSIHLSWRSTMKVLPIRSKETNIHSIRILLKCFLWTPWFIVIKSCILCFWCIKALINYEDFIHHLIVNEKTNNSSSDPSVKHPLCGCLHLSPTLLSWWWRRWCILYISWSKIYDSHYKQPITMSPTESSMAKRTSL